MNVRCLLVLAQTAALTAACTAAPAASPSPAASSVPTPVRATSAAASPAPPLRVGILLPYTEQAVNGDIGAAQKKAFDLYLKQHADALGGRAVKAVWSDESTDPKFNATKISLLVDQEKVEVLLGGGATPTAYALRDAAESSHLVYIDTNATGDALTRAVADCKPSCQSRYVFRTSASTWQLTQPFGRWATSLGGPHEFFAAYEDTVFGVEAVADFEQGVRSNSGKITGRAVVPAGTGDWTKVIATIKAQPTKAVFAVFETDDAVAFLKAWAAGGLPGAGYKLYGPGPLTDQQVLSLSQRSPVGAVTSQLWSSEIDNAATKALVDAFRKEYTDEDTGGPLTPDTYAVQMWDALAALDAALSKTRGDTAADALISALESASIRGPRGDLSFDRSTHGIAQTVYICEVRAPGSGVVNTVIDKIPGVADPGR